MHACFRCTAVQVDVRLLVLHTLMLYRIAHLDFLLLNAFVHALKTI